MFTSDIYGVLMYVVLGILASPIIFGLYFGILVSVAYAIWRKLCQK